MNVVVNFLLKVTVYLILSADDLPMDRSNLTLDWSRVGLIPASSDKLEMPIPQDEIDANGALTIADQNPAYK